MVDAGGQSVCFDNSLTGAVNYFAGDIVGESYRLISQLGRGGMGVVYLSEHLTFGQQYALKLLAPEQTNTVSWQRFKSEGQILGRLEHQNIVKIYNMGIDKKGCPFYVMALLRGASLTDATAHRPARPADLPRQSTFDQDDDDFSDFSVDDILKIYAQVCAGLAASHAKGVIHRDIKPSNIIITGPADATGSVKIVDFGLAALNDANREKQSLTMAGEIFGSPLYMSPEQSLGLKVDHRSDIYSFGCALFQSLTGRPPFIGVNSMDTLLMHQQSEPPTLARIAPKAKFSPAVELLLARLLAKDPVDRYQRIDLVKNDIERLLAGRSIGLALKNDDESIHYDKNDGTTSGTTRTKQLIGLFAAILCISGLAAWFVLNLNTKRLKAAAPITARPDKNTSTTSAISTAVPSDSSVATAESEKSETKEIESEKTDPDSLAGFNELSDITPDQARQYALKLKETCAIPIETVERNGRKYRRYVFPEDIKYGTFQTQRQNFDAKGIVEVPIGNERLSFYAHAPALAYPPLFDKLKNENIATFYLQGLNSEFDLNKIFDYVSTWPLLTDLTLDQSELLQFDFNNLSKLKHLKRLAVNDSNVDANQLAKWPGLPHLYVFQFGNMSNTDKLLKVAFSAPNLNAINISKCRFSMDVLDQLGKNPAVSDIKVQDCGLTNDDVARIAVAPNLQILSIAEPNVNEGVFAILRKHPHLASLNMVLYGKFSAEAKQRFKADMKNTQCRFENFDRY